MPNASANDLSGIVGAYRAPIRRIDCHGQAIGDTELGDDLSVVSFVRAGCSILRVTRLMDLDKPARDLPESLNGRVVSLAIDTDLATHDAPRIHAIANTLFGPGSHVRVLPSDAEAVKAMAKDLSSPAASLPVPPPTLPLCDRLGQIAMNYGRDPLDAARLARAPSSLDTFTQGLGHQPAPADPTR